jgi:hydrogenase expression/formation protein HypD
MKNQTLKEACRALSAYKLDQETNIMEVCGTHTTEFFRTGVKEIFPANLNLIDGPGCPVCVTPNEYLDRAIEIARQYKTIIATFGDMMHVPSSYSSLQREKARGMDVRIVYSPLDALQMARQNPKKELIFLSVGFETTIPTEAAAIKMAQQTNTKNFSLLVGNKLTPPAVRALLDSEEVNIKGFILPGHVSTITGIKSWRFIADEYKKPCVIAGFESRDLVAGTLILISLIGQGEATLINEYKRAVDEEGNLKAQELMRETFDLCDTKWRGIGMLPKSGMMLNAKYADFDAAKKFSVDPPPPRESSGCRCGDVLRGLITPLQCPLFGRKCTPQAPEGACMVSSEGSCAAYYKYHRS